MNTFTKGALTFLAASTIASVAMAAPGDATYGSAVKAQADVNQLTTEIQHLGAQPVSNVDLSNAHSMSAQAKLLNVKAQDLQLQLNELKSQNY